MAILCPITNQAKGYPFEVQLPEGLDITGVVLSDQVKSLDWLVRRAEYIGQLPRTVYREVLSKLSVLIEEQG